ncbi:MAG: YeaH/YhbH family protein [Gammaproteobacteria bacterium]|nr:YeaH/YhbH family protein [Gammaproteobacteria bacterium]
MSYILDRRRNSKNKSAVNRQRFLERYKKHIKKAVADAVDKRSITDMERGEEVSIPGQDISEPVFQHGNGGRRTIVHPGNKEFIAGDRIARPKGGGGGGGGEGDASDSGEGMDDFVFQLTQDEFLEFLFDDLALPNLTKRHLKGNSSFKYEHAGFTNDGVPAKLSVLRSLQQAKARRIALTGESRRLLREANEQLDEAHDQGDELKSRRLAEEIERLEKRVARVPFLDTTDLRYNLHVKKPIPTSQAVMFCLMDVSGSMDQHIKDMAKRFYLLLYMFLKRHYEKTEIVFIRHHTVAKEVDEQEFFYSRETGGTVVSSALKLMQEVMEQRYSPNEWNIYGAQASDGDNWNDDSPTCRKLLEENILPMVQYFSYVEITKRSHQALWREYEQVADMYPDAFAQRHITDVGDIFPVFHDLFQKKDAA